MGGDTALRDHPGRPRGPDRADHLDHGVGDAAGDREGVGTVLAAHEVAARGEHHVLLRELRAHRLHGLREVRRAPCGVEQRGHGQLDLGVAAALLQHAQLAGRETDVGADDDQAVRRAVRGHGQVLGGEHARAVLARERSHHARPAAGDDRAPLGLEPLEGRGEHVEVRVLLGVDRDPAAVPRGGEDRGDGVDPGAEVLEVHAQHVVGTDGPAGALLEDAGKVGAAVAEGRVAREVGLRDGQPLALHQGVVHAVGGGAARLDHGGDQ